MRTKNERTKKKKNAIKEMSIEREMNTCGIECVMWRHCCRCNQKYSFITLFPISFFLISISSVHIENDRKKDKKFYSKILICLAFWVRLSKLCFDYNFVKHCMLIIVPIRWQYQWHYTHTAKLLLIIAPYKQQRIKTAHTIIAGQRWIYSNIYF